MREVAPESKACVTTRTESNWEVTSLVASFGIDDTTAETRWRVLSCVGIL